MISDSLVKRYVELKHEAPGCVLLMQVGAFMKVLSVVITLLLIAVMLR